MNTHITAALTEEAYEHHVRADAALRTHCARALRLRASYVRLIGVFAGLQAGISTDRELGDLISKQGF